MEGIKMVEIPNDAKRLLFEKNSKRCIWAVGTFFYLGLVFLVIGIVSDAMNKVLGLEPVTWLIMWIGFWMTCFFYWLRAYYASLHGMWDTTKQKE
jgi:hypothetical protein